MSEPVGRIFAAGNGARAGTFFGPRGKKWGAYVLGDHGDVGCETATRAPNEYEAFRNLLVELEKQYQERVALIEQAMSEVRP